MPPRADRMRVGSFEIDLRAAELLRNGVKVRLQEQPLRVLVALLENPGEVVTREQLLDSVWGYTTIPFTRTVDTHVAKLRKKIEVNPDEPRHLVTVHRLGYKFVG